MKEAAIQMAELPHHQVARAFAATIPGFALEPHRRAAVEKSQPPAAAAGWSELSRRSFLQNQIIKTERSDSIEN